MKKELINKVVDRLTFAGEVQETKNSTRYIGDYFTDEDQVAKFTIIFPHTDNELDDNYKVQFNGKDSQRLNKKYNLKEHIESVVNDAIEYDESGENNNFQNALDMFNMLGSTLSVQRKRIDKTKRKKRNSQAKRSRRINRMRKR